MPSESTAIEQEAVPGTRRHLESPQRIVKLLNRSRLTPFSGFGLWAIFIIVFAFWVPDTFFTSETLKSVLSSQAVTAILALAIVFPLAAGVFDLSAAQNVGLSALVCGAVMSNKPHLSPMVAVALTLTMGTGIGVVNGALVSWVGVNSFIATLGTQSLLLATASLIGHGQYVGPFPTSFQNLTAGEPLGIPIIAIYMLILAVVAWYLLHRTPIGRRVFATGANAEAARLAGVRTARIVFGSMIVCGLLASLAGVLLASQLNSTNETIGPQYLLPAYAAAFLGATQIIPGRFNVWGTILAIFLLGTGVEGLQLAGANVWATDYFSGVALIGAVSISVLSEKARGRRERRRAAARQGADE